MRLIIIWLCFGCLSLLITGPSYTLLYKHLKSTRPELTRSEEIALRLTIVIVGIVCWPIVVMGP